MADTADLKYCGREAVWVRLPPSLPKGGESMRMWLISITCGSYTTEALGEGNTAEEAQADIEGNDSMWR